MSGLFPALLLGALILLCGSYFVAQSWRTRKNPLVTIDDYSNAREALDAAFVEAAMIERIFSVEDLEFIARAGTPRVRSLFFRERKRLALRWIRKTQKQVRELMNLHLRLANYTYNPRARFELELGAKYAAFALVSNAVVLLVWLIGPFRVTRIIGYTIRASGNFCTVFSLRLEQVDPARLGSTT